MLSLSLRGKYPIVFSQQMIRQLTDSHTNTITRPYSEYTVHILNSRRKTNSKILYLCTFASTFISICALAKHWTKLNITPFFIIEVTAKPDFWLSIFRIWLEWAGERNEQSENNNVRARQYVKYLGKRFFFCCVPWNGCICSGTGFWHRPISVCRILKGAICIHMRLPTRNCRISRIFTT